MCIPEYRGWNHTHWRLQIVVGWKAGEGWKITYSVQSIQFSLPKTFSHNFRLHTLWLCMKIIVFVLCHLLWGYLYTPSLKTMPAAGWFLIGYGESCREEGRSEEIYSKDGHTSLRSECSVTCTVVGNKMNEKKILHSNAPIIQ